MVINEPVLRVQRRAPEHSSARCLFSVAWLRFHKGVLHVQSTHTLAAMHRLDEPSGKRRLREGKISLLEAEMLPDRKHYIKKRKVQIFTCSHTAGSPTQDWLSACEMTDVWAFQVWETCYHLLKFAKMLQHMNHKIPACWSWCDVHFQLQVIYFTFTIDSLFKWLRIDACWGWKTLRVKLSMKSHTTIYFL